ncbi:arsenate reductase/protein-tyrosine-phosphatase family protein [Phytoactinopolyspora halotolerans]|uniref:ArsR family transcriptional regulator n=1 Tax=Phytoactinopolyspora halotolerans TaxID=1981512 RepID=A0A6L9S3F4_9ACTN|nr:ArsR family transcriptional regulator [Phytoactinopolyspora halotolerans]NED99360.1 ArsR family transcriptional regulator [Phytoactinopolyspora halotolerans]
MNTEANRVGRARVHAALGDPARLEIVDALASGDAAPGEIARQLGMGSNLVAHHLKILEQACVVRRLRSEGDRRRTYVTLVPETLHGLAIGDERHAPRVVFVCAQNSARSQLAAALWGASSDVPVDSAGTQPASRVHPGAEAAAARHGLRLRTLKPRHLAEVARADDLVVAVCDQAHEELGDGLRLHWSIPDPVRVGTDVAFDDTVDRLRARVAQLAGTVKPAR